MHAVVRHRCPYGLPPQTWPRRPQSDEVSASLRYSGSRKSKVDGRFWRIVLKNSPIEAQGVR
jgi:hypothetical protein